MERIRVIAGKTYLCGCGIQPRQPTCPTHGTPRAVDLRFTYEPTATLDGWRVSIDTPAAREWCAEYSNGCFDTHIAHRNVGAVIERAAAAGLYVRVE